MMNYSIRVPVLINLSINLSEVYTQKEFRVRALSLITANSP
jgi:hypothetical protein